MGDLSALLIVKSCQVKNTIRVVLKESKFRIVVIAISSLLFWAGFYLFFYYGLKFFQTQLGDNFSNLAQAIFDIFFFALMIMLIISNAIIAYSAFFKIKELNLLFSLPVKIENIFFYKYFESLGFSSWALLFLATPLVVAFGQVFERGFDFYLICTIFFVFFLFIPANIGALVTMISATYLPKFKRQLFTIGFILLVVIVLIAIWKIIQLRSRYHADVRLIVEVFEQISFTRNPILPSYWISSGIFALSRNDYNSAYFFLLVTLSNCIFPLAFLYAISDKILLKGWHVIQSSSFKKNFPRSGIIDWIFTRLFFFLNQQTRLIMIKDIKSFVRDPVQWSQFLIFFGLLAIYFFNLRSFGYEERGLKWRNLINHMNLVATSLTLSTFSARFVFPQLSLEGRRFWILGMSPIKREDILYGKLAFSFFSSLFISEVLIGISSYMLKIPPVMVLLNAVSLLGICLGLSGMAVGLGAVYPNFREDNPAKIISGFGGTLNLLLNLFFVLTCVVIQSIPFTLQLDLKATFDFKTNVFISISLICALSLIACVVPVYLGLRAIRRLEV